MDQTTEAKIKQIIREELVKALGCTEPIAIAYASAKAREILEREPERLLIECSGNMIKNAKSVVVPMTDNLKGIEASCITGAIAGDASKKLEVLSGVTPEDNAYIKTLLDRKICTVKNLDSEENLHIIVHEYAGSDEVTVTLMHTHLGITEITKNGEILFAVTPEEEKKTEYSCLCMDTILEFAQTADLSDIRDIFEEQIRCNCAISREGMTNDWGVGVGKATAQANPEDVRRIACARAAAGSDARMSGCEMPVIINSGSGNQGITACLPVVTYAEKYQKTTDELIRALIISNLVAIYLKCNIGRLSAYCGVVSAAAGAGAGIMYLLGGDRKAMEDTITNTLGNVSGIICDGAGPSCAAKILSAVDAALLGVELVKNGKVFHSGEGIVKDNLQHTLDGIIKLAKEGMYQTDKVILDIMVND